tara:strand:- start:3949 stop:4131 length:183 start_codon:yes stop_codon:yes gene_type:complete
MIDFNHLKKNDMSYYAHFKRATYISINMIVGGLLCCIHAFIPFVFVHAGSSRIKKLYKIL